MKRSRYLSCNNFSSKFLIKLNVFLKIIFVTDLQLSQKCNIIQFKNNLTNDKQHLTPVNLNSAHMTIE